MLPTKETGKAARGQRLQRRKPEIVGLPLPGPSAIGLAGVIRALLFPERGVKQHQMAKFIERRDVSARGARDGEGPSFF